MKYVATIEGQEYMVEIGGSGEITINDSPCTVHLEGIGGDSLFSLLIGTASYEVFVEHCRDYGILVEPCRDTYYVTARGYRYEVQVEDLRLRRRDQRRGVERPGEQVVEVTSPMPGVVVDVLVREGQGVQAGDSVAILEAMKMENDIWAPSDGVVESVHVTPGQTVNLNDIIVRIGPPEGESEEGRS